MDRRTEKERKMERKDRGIGVKDRKDRGKGGEDRKMDKG